MTERDPWFAGLRASVLRWRLKRAEMALADDKHYFQQWVNPTKWRGTPPSEEARWHKRIVRRERRVIRLRIALRGVTNSHE